MAKVKQSKDFACVPSDALLEFIENTFLKKDPLLKGIRERAEKAGLPDIHVHPMDGLHLEVLASAANAKKIVEIGTLGGYSGVCLLRGGGPNAKLYTFEIHDRNAAVADQTFRDAGLSHQVQIFLGSALDELKKVEPEGPFDLVFIDADKSNYPSYLDWAAKNLRVGGLVVGDNTFAFGRLGEGEMSSSPSVIALEKFNRRLAEGGEFRATILPTGEGLSIGVKL